MNFKNTLRNKIDNILNSLTLNEQKEKSLCIEKRLINLKTWGETENIFIYLNFKAEVITENIVNKAFELNKKVHIPRIDGKIMTFHEINKKTKLIKSKYGLMEPSPDIPESVPTSNDLFIIPGVAFSEAGERLGRGGGYYDRYLSKHSDIIKIAITYQEQICDDIPTEKWDQKMNKVITDKNTYDTGE